MAGPGGLGATHTLAVGVPEDLFGTFSLASFGNGVYRYDSPGPNVRDGVPFNVGGIQGDREFVIRVDVVQVASIQRLNLSVPFSPRCLVGVGGATVTEADLDPAAWYVQTTPPVYVRDRVAFPRNDTYLSMSATERCADAGGGFVRQTSGAFSSGCVLPLNFSLAITKRASSMFAGSVSSHNFDTVSAGDYTGNAQVRVSLVRLVYPSGSVDVLTSPDFVAC